MKVKIRGSLTNRRSKSMLSDLLWTIQDYVGLKEQVK